MINITRDTLSKLFIRNEHEYYLNRLNFPFEYDLYNKKDRHAFVCFHNAENENNEYENDNSSSSNDDDDDDDDDDKKKLQYINKIKPFRWRNFVSSKNCKVKRNNVSIFFNAIKNADLGLIKYCIEQCDAQLEKDEFVTEYKGILNCSSYDDFSGYHGCHKFNCVSKNFPDKEKITPLMYAVLCGNYYSVKYLLSLGANVNFETACFRMTPLLLACRVQKMHIIKYLVNNGANIIHCDVLNRTCLMHAMSDVCWYYDKYYSDFDRERYFPPLSKYYLFLKTLFNLVNNRVMNKRKFINTRERIRNYTVLHLAIKFCNKTLIETLLTQYGAFLNLKVYKDNNLKSILKYQKVIETGNFDYNFNDDDNDDVITKKINFLCYCITNVKFNYMYPWTLLSYLITVNIDNTFYSKVEVSEACLIMYLEFYKNNKNNKYKTEESKFLKKYIHLSENQSYLLRDSYPHFMDNDYFIMCLRVLGCNNEIIYKLFSQRCQKYRDDLRMQNIIDDSVFLLEKGGLSPSHKMWLKVFEELLLLLTFSMNHCNVFTILREYLTKEFEKFSKCQRDVIITETGTVICTKYNFFEYCSKEYRDNVLFSIFNAIL